MYRKSTDKQQEQVHFIEYWLELPYLSDINNYNDCKEFIDNYFNDALLASNEFKDSINNCLSSQ